MTFLVAIVFLRRVPMADANIKILETLAKLQEDTSTIRESFPISSSQAGRMNRFSDNNSVVMTGSHMSISPRRLLDVVDKRDFLDEEEPAMVSETVCEAEPYQDPHANFIDDIRGWEQEAGEDLLTALTAETTSTYKYLSYDNTPEPEIPKKKTRRKVIIPRRKPSMKMENEEDLDVLLDQSLNIHSVPSHEEQKSEVLPVIPPEEVPAKTKLRKETPKVQEINVASVSVFNFENSCVKKNSEGRIEPSDAEKMLLSNIRRKLCASATVLKPNKPSVPTTGPNSIIGLAGKKYYVNDKDGANSQIVYRAKTADVLKPRKALLPEISSLSSLTFPESMGTPSELRSISRNPSQLSKNPARSMVITSPFQEGFGDDSSCVIKKTPKKLSPFGFRQNKIIERRTGSNMPLDAPMITRGQKPAEWFDFHRNGEDGTIPLSSQSSKAQLRIRYE
jgi:hypothetical protein